MAIEILDGVEQKGTAGAAGETGADGATGETGATGAGIASGGSSGQVLIKNSATDFDTTWTTSGSYTYFPVWAEESSTIAAGATEYAYGNGDDTPLASGIVIGVDCELYACGGENEGGTGVNLEVIKNGTSIAETGAFNSNTIVNLGTPVSFTAGDVMNFRTKAVTVSGASCRPVAWFRVEAIGMQGPTGPSGDITWQGDWSAGTYTLNQAVSYSGASYVCNAATTVEQPSASATDWDVLASKGDTGPTGTTLPYIDLGKTSVQDTGGVNGTKTYINWETQNYIDAGTFTHSTTTNPNRITVDVDGRYAIRGSVGATQGGANRTTEMLYVRVNGTTEYTVGSQNSYSRGSIYGDKIHARYDWELDLSANDYIEFYTYIIDTDATYVINTVPGDCGVIMRKLT